MKQRIIMILLMLLIVLGSFLTPSPALAANAVVGSGTPASCTESAFDVALAQVSGSGGTMTFNCGLAEHTITLTTQKIINLTNVTINGNNRIVLDGSTGVRHFFVGNGVTFTLQNIKLRNGDPLASGGALEINESKVFLSSVELSNNYASTVGGAIYCYGTSSELTITNSHIVNNSANTSGGGLYNDGCPVSITNTPFLHNTATNFAGAIYNAAGGDITLKNTLLQDNEAMDGPGMYNATDATATLTNIDFYSNSGSYGGGIENSGTLTINDSLFRENTVTGSGGGLWNLNGSVTINRSTFRGNSAYEGAGINSYGSDLTVNYANLTNNISSGSGGGLYHGGGTAFLSNLTISGNQAVNGAGVYQSSDDNLTLTNATIANNSASSLGGGLYHYNRYAILTNVTMANNTAAAGNAIYEDSPMDTAHPGVVQLVNTVIFGSANNCDGGLFTSLGDNLSQGTCSSLTHVNDIPNYTGALNIKPLALNGGIYAMQTMRPILGSPVINAGSNASCPATDQLGVARPKGAVCDIGAYEFNPITVTLGSIAAQDGWVLEAGENTTTGGTMNNAVPTFNVGDDATKKQYRGVLSFNTSGLPDTAIITSVVLKVKQKASFGSGNPVTILGGFVLDIKTGFFSNLIGLQTNDFQAAGTKTLGPITPPLTSGTYSFNLINGKNAINKLASNGGVTQIRLRFMLDDNNNAIADYLSLFSSDAGIEANRPQLLISYTMP